MRRYLWPFIAVCGVALGAAGGWYARTVIGDRNAAATIPPALRAGGYDLINPLLLCQTSDMETSENKDLEKKIKATIDARVKDGTFVTASVYLRAIPSGRWAEVNGSEQYYPASMEKVPVMMAYYSLSESDPSILSKKMTYTGASDANTQQEVPVQDPLIPGHSYTVAELIDHMITHSDNNATELLFNNLDQSVFRDAFSELHIPFLGPGDPPTNFMTARDYSLFLRVLYNSTYLDRANSERALDTLSRSDFTEGIVAGVPQGVKVAHKFGLASVAPDGTHVTAREMHDCGLVYAGSDPYVLCIMTKSTGSNLQQIEAGIADISRAAYQNAAAQ